MLVAVGPAIARVVVARKVVHVEAATVVRVVVPVAALFPTALVAVGCQAVLIAAQTMQVVAFALAGKVVVQKQVVADPYLPVLVEILRDSSLRLK